jgi:plastocyanin
MKRSTPVSAALVILVAAALQVPAAAGTHEVRVSNFAFDPAEVMAVAGDTVRWIWEGGSHTVTSGSDCTPDGLFDEPLTAASPLYEHTFDGPVGTMPYFCIPHCLSGMTGEVVVTAPASGIGTGVTAQSTDSRLLQAEPNPFGPVTTVRFNLQRRSRVMVRVRDLTGRTVTTLVDGEFTPGVHAASWTGETDGGKAVPSGVYYAELVSNEARGRISFLLLR